MKLKFNFLFSCFLFFVGFTHGQMDKFKYKHELTGISETWHSLHLPGEIFSNVTRNLRDIRIYGITADKDTVEAPYVLNVLKDRFTVQEVPSQVINESYSRDGYYFTFHIPVKKPVNQIKLDFKLKNFDWKLQLQGSLDQKEWFTIVDDYRILSIENDLTSYKFTNLVFPSSDYNYYRIKINSQEKPQLRFPVVSHKVVDEGEPIYYNVVNTKFTKDTEQKIQITNVALASLVPVSFVKVYVSSNFDYYRPVVIEYIIDSVKTDKGWHYNYNTLTSSVLSSMDENIFYFESAILKNIRISVHNGDNQALKIDSILAGGYIHEMIIRFTTPADYFLVYGNEKAGKPAYDITRFMQNVPDKLPLLNVGALQLIKSDKVGDNNMFSLSRIWLWAMMIVIILLLAWFSLKMMRSGRTE